MNRDLTPEELERYVDGEVDRSEAAGMEQHLRQCAHCASAALQLTQMKRTIRDAMTREAPSSLLRQRVKRQMSATAASRLGLPAWGLAAAAVAALVFIAIFSARTRAPSALPELVDM